MADFEPLEDDQIKQFSKQYPFLSFKRLALVDDNISTDDGCIRYKHVITRQLFTWNMFKKVWYPKNLYDLFFGKIKTMGKWTSILPSSKSRVI